MNSKQSLSAEGSARSIEQIHQLFIVPELERRLQSGTLDSAMIASHPTAEEPGRILMPQISLVIIEEMKPIQVLFNEEAQVLLLAKVDREMIEGDNIALNDALLAGFELPLVPENASWVLVINQNGQIQMSFDLRRNRGFARDHVKMGDTFFDSAKKAHRKGEFRPCIEFLFHASEKYAKATLLLLPLELRAAGDGILVRKQHPEIRSLFEKMGNDSDGQKLLSDIGKLRNPANYFTEPFNPSPDEVRDLLERTKSLRARVTKRIPKSIADTPQGPLVSPSLNP